MHVNFACKYNSFTESESSERKEKMFQIAKKLCLIFAQET